MNKYINPDKTFNEKLYYEDQVRMLSRNGHIESICDEAHQTTITFKSGRKHTYPMKLSPMRSDGL